VHGVLITGVEDKSPAASAGLVKGDVVVSLDGADMRDANKLRNTIAMRGAGKKAELAIIRGKDHKTVKVTLGELPDQVQPAADDAAPQPKPKKKQRIIIKPQK